MISVPSKFLSAMELSDDGVSRLGLGFGDCGGSRIEENQVVALFEDGNVRVPRNDHVAWGKWRKRIVRVKMSVGDEESPSIAEEDQVV